MGRGHHRGQGDRRCLALDAFLTRSSLRYSGKAMRIRAIGYAGACCSCRSPGACAAVHSHIRASSTWP